MIFAEARGSTDEKKKTNFFVWKRNKEKKTTKTFATICALYVYVCTEVFLFTVKWPFIIMEKRDLFLYSNNKNLHRIAKKNVFFLFLKTLFSKIVHRDRWAVAQPWPVPKRKEIFSMCCCWANTRHFRIREFGVRYVQKTLLTWTRPRSYLVVFQWIVTPGGDILFSAAEPSSEWNGFHIFFFVSSPAADSFSIESGRYIISLETSFQVNSGTTRKMNCPPAKKELFAKNTKFPPFFLLHSPCKIAPANWAHVEVKDDHEERETPRVQWTLSRWRTATSWRQRPV